MWVVVRVVVAVVVVVDGDGDGGEVDYFVGIDFVVKIVSLLWGSYTAFLEWR